MSRVKGATQQLEQAAASAKSVIIERAKQQEVYLEIAGNTPLIQNNFSQKSLEEMLRKHMGLTVERERKKPRDVIEAAKIKNLDGRICLPPTAIKKGMLSAAGTIKSKGALKPWQLKSQLFVVGESLPITFEKEVPRMDIVRTSGMNRQPDVRFRPSYMNWKCRVGVRFADGVAVQTVVDLLDRAGNIGVGEWRPEKSGTFGTYRVVRNITDRKELAEIERDCASGLIPLRIPEWAMDAEIDPSLLAKIMGEQEQDVDADDGDEEFAQQAQAGGARKK